jgi:hypothetical protein
MAKPTAKANTATGAKYANPVLGFGKALFAGFSRSRKLGGMDFLGQP